MNNVLNSPLSITTTSPAGGVTPPGGSFFDVLGGIFNNALNTAGQLGTRLLEFEILDEIIDVRNDILGPQSVSGSNSGEPAQADPPERTSPYNIDRLIGPGLIILAIILLFLLTRSSKK